MPNVLKIRYKATGLELRLSESIKTPDGLRRTVLFLPYIYDPDYALNLLAKHGIVLKLDPFVEIVTTRRVRTGTSPMAFFGEFWKPSIPRKKVRSLEKILSRNKF